MARFDVGLDVNPTATVGVDPVVVDTSSLAVAQLAQAFTGQYLNFKAEEKKEQKEAAVNKTLAGFQAQIFKLGNAAEQGTLTLSKANIQARKLAQELTVQNPALSKEIGSIYSSTIKSAGLSAGKSQAQIRQEDFQDLKGQLKQLGWVSNVTPEETVEQLATVHQEHQRAVASLDQSLKELQLNSARLGLDSKARDSEKTLIKDRAKSSIRKIVNAQYERVSSRVQELNRLLTDSNKEETFKELEALKTQILSSVPQVPRSFLDPTEVEAMTGALFSPIDALQSRIEKNETASWAESRIRTTKALATEDALKSPEMLGLHTFSRLVGDATLSRLSVNQQFDNYMSGLLSGKGGKGTAEVDPSILQEASSFIKDVFKNKNLPEEAKEGAAKLLESRIQDTLTDELHGRITKPSDVAGVVNLLASPEVHNKVISGEIELSPRVKAQAVRLLEANYTDKLVPSIKGLMDRPVEAFDGQPVGSLVDFEVTKTGTLKATLKPAAKRQTVPSVNTTTDRSAPVDQTNERAAIFRQNELSKTKAELDVMVTSLNRAAKAMSTVSQEEDSTQILESLLTGLLGGEEQQQTTSPRPEPNAEILEVLETLPKESKERFDNLPEEDKEDILAMTPRQLRRTVMLLAPK